MQWFTRYGTEFSGNISDANEAKGTASHVYVSKCSRCGGAGGSDKWAHTGWTCFECGGSGKGPVRTEKLYCADRLAKLNAAQAKRDAIAAVKAKAQQEEHDRIAKERYAAFRAENRELLEAIKLHAESDTFLADIHSRLEDGAILSENQITAAKNAIARRLEAETIPPVPEGRMQIEGIVMSLRVEENDFGKVTKILVKIDAGWKVWGSRPAADWKNDENAQCAQVGDRISFKATVTQSDRDKSFGFFSRPANGKILSRQSEAA